MIFVSWFETVIKNFWFLIHCFESTSRTRCFLIHWFESVNRNDCFSILWFESMTQKSCFLILCFESRLQKKCFLILWFETTSENCWFLVHFSKQKQWNWITCFELIVSLPISVTSSLERAILALQLPVFKPILISRLRYVRSRSLSLSLHEL